MSNTETIDFVVSQARNLPKEDLIGSIDSYFVVKYGDNSQKTETVENSKNPVFSRAFKFEYDASLGDEITVELWDWDKISNDDLVATTKISVLDYKNKRQKKWFPLTAVKPGKNGGEVELEIVYNAYVPPEEVSTRAFDVSDGGFKDTVAKFVQSKPFIQQLINFYYTSVIWQNIITYAILASIVVINYFIGVSTNWKTLTYIFLLSFELYIIFFILSTYTKFLSQPPEEVERSTNIVLNYVFSINVLPEQNPFDRLKPLENFSKTPYYFATTVVVTLLLLTLVSSIFSGAFVAFVVLGGLLLVPGIVTKNLHVAFVAWWIPTVWTPILKPQYEAKVKPLYDAKVKPIVDKLLGSGDAGAGAGASSSE